MLDPLNDPLPGQAGPKTGPEREITSEADMRSDAEAPGPPAPTDPLDAYFERLDAAFATIRQKDYRSPAPPLDPPLEEPPPAEAPAAPRQAGPAQPHLAAAFAALLAAEEGLVPLQPGALVPPVTMIPDEVIELIVERVLARIAEDPMRRPAMETAERLTDRSSDHGTGEAE